MRRFTFMLLMCACIVAQEANHRLEYYKFTKCENGDYNLGFKISNGIERSEYRRTLQTGDYEVRGLYSYIAPNNQHVIVHYSPKVQGFKIWSPPTIHPPMLPFGVKIKRFDKLPEHQAPSTQDIHDFYKYIFKSKSEFEKAEVPIVRVVCTDKLLSPSKSPSFLPQTQDVRVIKMPVIPRVATLPFGKGPDGLAESLKKRSKEKRLRGNKINSNKFKISKTNLIKSAIGPRFQDN